MAGARNFGCAIATSALLAVFVACSGSSTSSPVGANASDASASDATSSQRSGPPFDAAPPSGDDAAAETDSGPPNLSLSIDGGTSCASAADCHVGAYCVTSSDAYRPGSDGDFCMPFPAECSTCGCATQHAQDVIGSGTGCSCYDTSGYTTDPDAVPVVVHCSVA